MRFRARKGGQERPVTYNRTEDRLSSATQHSAHRARQSVRELEGGDEREHVRDEFDNFGFRREEGTPLVAEQDEEDRVDPGADDRDRDGQA